MAAHPVEAYQEYDKKHRIEIKIDTTYCVGNKYFPSTWYCLNLNSYRRRDISIFIIIKS